jgi:hypothetical protein
VKHQCNKKCEVEAWKGHTISGKGSRTNRRVVYFEGISRPVFLCTVLPTTASSFINFVWQTLLTLETAGAALFCSACKSMQRNSSGFKAGRIIRHYWSEFTVAFTKAKMSLGYAEMTNTVRNFRDISTWRSSWIIISTAALFKLTKLECVFHWECIISKHNLHNYASLLGLHVNSLQTEMYSLQKSSITSYTLHVIDA